MSDAMVEFLLARVADRERYAKDTHDRDCETVPREGMYGPFPCNCGEPERVLAECEAARRRIVEDCDERSLDLSGAEPSAYALADRILRALSSVYADHPDFREEWRP